MHLSKTAERRKGKTSQLVRGERFESVTWDHQTKRVLFQVVGKEKGPAHYRYTVSLTASELRSLCLAGVPATEQRLWSRLWEVWEHSLSDMKEE